MDESSIYNDTKHPLLSLTGDANSGISPLEQEVLDEYERLLKNMNEVSSKTMGNERAENPNLDLFFLHQLLGQSRSPYIYLTTATSHYRKVLKRVKTDIHPRFSPIFSYLQRSQVCPADQ